VTRASISSANVRNSLFTVTGAFLLKAGFAIVAQYVAAIGDKLDWEKTVPRFIMKCAMLEKLSASLSPTSPRPKHTSEVSRNVGLVKARS
jgi:hypothetical protein